MRWEGMEEAVLFSFSQTLSCVTLPPFLLEFKMAAINEVEHIYPVLYKPTCLQCRLKDHCQHKTTVLT